MSAFKKLQTEFDASWRETHRGRMYEILERSNVGDLKGRVIDFALIVLIILNITAVILETVDSIFIQFEPVFVYFEYFSVTIFTIEYIARIWSCVEAKLPEARKSHWRERLAWAFSPAAVIDFVAIAPFYLSILFAIDLRFLRVLRLLRILKLTRYSSALTMLLDVIRERANAFFAGFFILLVLLIIASSGAYLVEHKAQPEAFGSIPDAMWWAVATLTTVGYGDVTPITALGKLFGALVTIIGIGMAALPAGILASGFADHLSKTRESLKRDYMAALEDGIIDSDETLVLEARRKELGLDIEEAIEIEELVRQRQQRNAKTCCPHCGKTLKFED